MTKPALWTAHIAGPVRHGLQMCTRCGTVLLNDEIAGLRPGTLTTDIGFPAATDVFVSPDGRSRTTFLKNLPTGVVPCQSKKPHKAHAA